jgi:hypothetical protein
MNNQNEVTIDQLPVNYAAPEVHELGKCEDLTLGGSGAVIEWSGGKWC